MTSDPKDELEIPDPGSNVRDTIGLALISTAPLVGPVLAAMGQTAINHRAAQRRARFEQSVVADLERLGREKTDFTAADVLDSDEFLAAYAKAARAADETASEDKRARLARALTHMGPWDRLEANHRQIVFDLIARYDDLHIFLLDFFRDPRAWIQRTDPAFNPGFSGLSSIYGVLASRVFPGEPGWAATVEPALAQLSNDRTTDVPLKTTMTVDGTLAPRNTPLGNDVLRFFE